MHKVTCKTHNTNQKAAGGIIGMPWNSLVYDHEPTIQIEHVGQSQE